MVEKVRIILDVQVPCIFVRVLTRGIMISMKCFGYKIFQFNFSYRMVQKMWIYSYLKYDISLHLESNFAEILMEASKYYSKPPKSIIFFSVQNLYKYKSWWHFWHRYSSFLVLMFRCSVPKFSFHWTLNVKVVQNYALF